MTELAARNAFAPHHHRGDPPTGEAQPGEAGRASVRTCGFLVEGDARGTRPVPGRPRCAPGHIWLSLLARLTDDERTDLVSLKAL